MVGLEGESMPRATAWMLTSCSKPTSCQKLLIHILAWAASRLPTVKRLGVKGGL
jgi:hypothetical protein